MESTAKTRIQVPPPRRVPSTMTGTAQHRVEQGRTGHAHRWKIDRQIIANIFSLSFILSILAIFYLLMDTGADWQGALLPACRELLAFRSPYDQFNFFNPAWALLPLLPLSFLPDKVGSVILSITNVMVFAYIAHRLKARPLIVILIATLPPVLYSTNIDWMVALGLIMPPQIGLFFVLVKPQVGVFIALFWFSQAARYGVREVLRTFAPVTVAFILSFIVFGFYPLKWVGQLSLLDNHWNIQIFPYGIPVGLVLIGTSLRNKQLGLSATAAPFLSPYSLMWSWPVAVLGLLPDAFITTLAIAGIWIIDLSQTGLARYILYMLLN
jgi:hypothetical protein